MKLKLFLLSILTILLFSQFINAFEIDNWKYERQTTFDGKSIQGNKLLEKYNPIEIKNSFGLGKILWEGYMIQHDETCGQHCQSTQMIKLSEKGVLIEDIIFETLQEDGSWIEQPIRSYEIKVDGNKYILGTELSVGTYEVELIGEKKFSRTVEWIYVTQGENLDSWAVWGSGPLINNLVAYWDFDEGSGLTAADSLGNFDQTLIAPMTTNNWTTGILGNAIVYNGTGGYSTFGNGSLGNAINWSMNFWVNADIIGSASTMTFSEGIELSALNFQADGKGQFDVGSGWEIFDIGYTTDWTMITLTYNQASTNFSIYSNGVFNNSQSVAHSNNNATTGNRWGVNYHGLWDESAWFNKSLSQSEIDLLYNSGVGFAYPFAETFVTLNSPIDNYKSLPGNVTFSSNLTITGATGVNMSLWHNASGTFELNQTNNVTGTTNITEFNATFGAGYYLWNVQVCDSDGDCGFAADNKTIHMSNLIVDSESHESQVQETEEQIFYVNVSTASDTLSLLANIIYNGTSYSANVYENSTTSYFINYTLETPAIIGSIPQSRDFIWEFVLATGSGTEYINSSTYSQTVTAMNTINITNLACSPGYFQAINYTFADAANFTALTPDVKYNFKYGISNTSTKEIYGEHNNTAILRVCVNATNNNYRIGYGEIDYQEQGYVERRYYMFDEHSISNSTGETYELYDLINGDSTSFIFEIKNTFLNPFADKYISLLRWYPQNDTYKTTEMAITDADGKTVMKVHTEDVDYRVGIYYKNGSLIKLADPVRMACLIAPCTYTLRITTDGVDYNEIYDVESSLTWDETNERFVYIWNDPSQNTEEMQLLVTKDLGFQPITICNTTGTGYTGVLTCSCVNQTGLLRAQAFRTASPLTAIADMFHTIRSGMNNTIGLFISFILALVMALIGIFSPIGAIIMMVIALLPAVILGSITFPIMMGIGVLGGIIIHFMKKAP